jgi:methyl-accepting chemotaxis protein
MPRTAARNVRPFLLQTYHRDLGTMIVRLNEVAVPINVYGRHWGGIRLAYAD